MKKTLNISLTGILLVIALGFVGIIGSVALAALATFMWMGGHYIVAVAFGGFALMNFYKFMKVVTAKEEA